LQKLYQTLKEWKINPYMSVLKLPLLVDLQQRVGELVISVTSCFILLSSSGHANFWQLSDISQIMDNAHHNTLYNLYTFGFVLLLIIYLKKYLYHITLIIKGHWLENGDYNFFNFCLVCWLMESIVDSFEPTIFWTLQILN
jgi:hypothetical protein